jgi:hypothetical protein
MVETDDAARARLEQGFENEEEEVPRFEGTS